MSPAVVTSRASLAEFSTSCWVPGSAIAALLGAFSTEFIFALAGLTLLSTIANSLYTAVADAGAREVAVITLVVTASALSLSGIGAVFWGWSQA